MKKFYLVSGLLKLKDGQVIAAIDSNHNKTVAIALEAESIVITKKDLSCFIK